MSDDDEYEVDEYCPICGGPGSLEGILGYLAWYRCIDCGMKFSVRIEVQSESSG